MRDFVIGAEPTYTSFTLEVQKQRKGRGLIVELSVVIRSNLFRFKWNSFAPRMSFPIPINHQCAFVRCQVKKSMATFLNKTIRELRWRIDFYLCLCVCGPELNVSAYPPINLE